MNWIQRLIAFTLPLHLFAAETPFDKLPNQVKETLKSASAMVDLEGEPSALVAGSVNVITGDFCEHDVDMEIAGASSITLSRSHTSSDIKLPKKIVGPLQNGWNLSHHGKLIVCSENVSEFKNYITHEEGHGVSTLYEGKFSLAKISHKVSNKLIKRGLTNAGGEISGRTNRKNSRAFAGLSSSNGHVEMSHGGKKYFANTTTFPNHYLLVKEVSLNGDSVHYAYDKERRLQSIEEKSRSGRTLGKLMLSHHSKKHFKQDPHLSIKSSDGRKVRYQFINRNDRYLLNRVDRPNAPPVSYEYSTTVQDEDRITKKILPEGRFLGVRYYQQGKNNVRGHKIKILSLVDWKMGRVLELKAPIHPNGATGTLYTFQYERNKGKPGQPSGGITKVRDALNQRTHYLWDGYNRLKEIRNFDQNGLYSSDRLYWGADQTTNAGHLVTRAFSSEGKTHCIRHYRYDDYGNVLEKQLYGLVIGANAITPEMKIDGTPIENGCDKQVERYSYDSNHLKLTEENLRQRIIYRYQPGTDQLAAKFICDLSGKIHLRYFHEYDDNGFEILAIHDDGNTEDCSDLAGVTERHITRTTPRNDAPVGLPQEVAEYVLNGGEEELVKRTVNTHDEKGLLLQQEVYDAGNNLAHRQHWEYDSYGNPIKEINPCGTIKNCTYDANGNKTSESSEDLSVQLKYSRADQVIEKVTIFGEEEKLVERFNYDLLGRCIEKRDCAGQSTRYHYDSQNRLVATIYPNHVKSEMRYNGLNLPVWVKDGAGYELKIDYNILGKPLKIIYPNAEVETFEYSIDGLLIKHTAQNGNVTTNEYDYQGRLINQRTTTPNGLSQEKEWEYNALHLLSETDATGTTHFSYDAAGRVTRMSKNGYSESYIYDAMGRKCETIYPDSILIQDYDSLDRVIEERREDLTGVLISRSWYAYDAAGNQTEVMVDRGDTVAKERFYYNGLGECIRKIDPLGNETKIQYQYYPQKIVTTITPNGVVTEVTYDALDRPVRVSVKDMYGDSWRTEESEYDGNGNRVRLVETITERGNQSRQLTTEWSYDWFGRITGKTEAIGTPLQKCITMQYHNNGEKALVTKADGTVMHYEHDELGRLKHLVASDGTIDQIYHYDNANRLIQVDDHVQGFTTKRIYDVRGHLLSEELGNGLEVQTSYDASGRLESIVYHDQSRVDYQYDGYHLTRIERYTATGGSYQYNYHCYDLSGKVIKADGLEKEYDIMGRLVTSKAGNWIQHITGYNVDGTIQSVHTEAEEGTKDRTYQYDIQRQITQENERHYRWDSQYNYLGDDDEECQVNDLNQITTCGQSTYTYDLNGNLVKDPNGTYRYDALDRLIECCNAEGVHHYIYDSFNRLLKKNDTSYIYVGENEVGSVTAEQQIIQLRVLGVGLGAEIGATVAIETKGKVYRPTHDHAGNIVRLNGWETGQLVETIDYTAFGECSSPSSITPWLYSSKRWDADLNCYNYGRRYYSPKLKRWLTPDPIDRAAGPNIYAFVYNNPLIHVDLYGFAGVDRNRSHYVARRAFTNTSPTRRTFSWRRVLSAPGHAVKGFGSHCVPTHFGRDIVRRIGHFLAGHPQSTFTPTHRQPKSRVVNHIGWEGKAIRSHYNGINNSFEESLLIVKHISEGLHGIAVRNIYNSTEGTLNDLIETGLQKFGFKNDPVEVAYKQAKADLNNTDKKLIWSGHSQGTEIMYQVALRLTPEERMRIIAAGFGGARLLPSDLFGYSINYISTGDPIPALGDPVGYASALRSSGHYNTVFVKSQGITGLDHSMTGQTYMKSIEHFNMQLRRMNLGG